MRFLSSFLLLGLGLTAAACATASGPAPAATSDLSGDAFDWRNASFYYVTVDRFNDGNPAPDTGCHVAGVSSSAVDYQGGDWAGVTAKIREGYFTKLGINALMLSVPMENPSVAARPGGGDTHLSSAYHGYWPLANDANPAVLAPESCFGTIDELNALLGAAHSAGLKVVFDYAAREVHASSRLYAQHPDWFWPNERDGRDCVCGDGCSWEADANRCWLADYLPPFNYANADARAWSIEHAVAWATAAHDANGRGADGYRIETFGLDPSWTEALRERLRAANADTVVDRFYLVGHTFDFGNRDRIKTLVDPARSLDGQFDFPLRKNIVDTMLLRREPITDLARFMDENDAFYSPATVMTTFIGDPSLPRSIHLATDQPLWSEQAADGKDRAWANQPDKVASTDAYERVANAYAVLYTNRGAPLVYYGDEIGMPGAGMPDNQRPMTWSGYDANQLFLRDRIARLAALRAQHRALRDGTRLTINATATTWVYELVAPGDAVYVVINNSDEPQRIDGLPDADLYEAVMDTTAEDGPKVDVPPRQTRIYTRR